MLREAAQDTVVGLEVVTDSVPEPELTAELVEDTVGSTPERPAPQPPLNWPTLQALPEARMKFSYHYKFCFKKKKDPLNIVESVLQGY